MNRIYSVGLWRGGSTKKVVSVVASSAGHAAAKAIDANPEWDAYFVGEDATTVDRCSCGAFIMLDDWPTCPCGREFSKVEANSLDAVTITLPIPDARLHAHAKGGWRTRAGPTKALRDLAGHLAFEASRGRRPQWERATLAVAVFYPDRRRRDSLNTVHGLKPAIDGLVDAGLIADDCWSVLSIGEISASVDRANPRVEITLAKGADA